MEGHSADPGCTRLRATGIARSFGPTQAIRSASVELRPGVMLCLFREIVSRPRTLVLLLSTILQPDAGLLELGQARVRFPSPRAAIDAGVAAVFQEVLVAPSSAAAPTSSPSCSL